MLKRILESTGDDVEALEQKMEEIIQQDAMQQEDRTDLSTMCVECEDQPHCGQCEECGDKFCDMCFFSMHRKGSRQTHTLRLAADGRRISASAGPAAMYPAGSAAAVAKDASANPESQDRMTEESSPPQDSEESVEPTPSSTSGGSTYLRAEIEEYARTGEGTVPIATIAGWFEERSRYIPLRLTYEERKWLHLVQAALGVSEYTDKVDVYQTSKSKMRRVVEQVQDICAILSGLVVASDYRRGQELIRDRDFAANADFFQRIFEIARRYKIMNPERMRSTYGKLVYLLQDSVDSRIREVLDIPLVRPVQTVHAFLAAHGCLGLLREPLLMIATREILADGKRRSVVDQEIRQKGLAVKRLVAKYRREPEVTADDIERAIHSIGDNNAFLRFNRDPCDRMLRYLRDHFHAESDQGDVATSLAIVAGRGGARLTHSHKAQYSYVLQTLMLWREILNEFFKLWFYAEADLLSEHSPYMLRDTGQGLNRVQPAPNVSREMHRILYDVQRRMGSWVGSCAIHLGDHNVPNALMFIDKYTQIQRILNPIVIVLGMIPSLCESDPNIQAYVARVFGNAESAVRTILADFFRHGFDGSGADNFFDSGSCIDGRLTSAWEWCSKLHKKSYYPLFLLCQFHSFDGSEW